jgi:thioredoxin 1
MKILLFSASWCGQCKAYHPTLDKFIKDHPDIKLEEVDIEKDEKITKKYKIMNLPTTIILNDKGKEINRAMGIQTKEKLENLIKV